ncbi:response regulator [Pedobacter mucosus]|uniref:response regulator n=1 Tax=Pedobacter mucosus TaxID=2895286 RepID=UPI001EE3BD99|nr:response regulator [Pedobacter mucosus]UKT64645.1 response regulator [Pedobacter mucosus]
MMEDNRDSLCLIDVLIVEETLIDQKILARYLAEYDISYAIASDLPSAMHAFKSNRFKLLLLGIELFEMKGLELVALLRNNLSINIPIVAITAHEIDDIKEQCFKTGMNACFSKPIAKVDLVGILTQFLPIEN